MSGCEQHLPYLAAVADGEAELVPAASLSHITDCPDCAEEVASHRLLGARLRASVTADQLPVRRRVGRRWVLRLGATATAVVVLAAAAAGWHAYTGEDGVTAAVAVASEQPQFRSSDASSITSWCERASGRPMRDVRLPELSPLGARMDHQAGTDIVTVTYATAQGDRISVGWLDASQATTGKSEVQTRTIKGGTVLIVASPGGTAVISGSAPPSSLWGAAAGLEAVGSRPTGMAAT